MVIIIVHTTVKQSLDETKLVFPATLSVGFMKTMTVYSQFWQVYHVFFS